MRSISVGILAENIDDYLSQSKQMEQRFDNDFIKYQLFNFDFLSLADTSTKQYNNEISSNKNYKLNISKIITHQRRLIPFKSNKMIRKKRGLISKQL